MLKDYELAKSILKRLEDEPESFEIERDSKVVWFAIAKFYRELLYLSKTPESLLRYGRLAIISFLKASMQQAALKILEHITKKVLPSGGHLEKIEELTSLFDGDAADQAKIIYLRELFLVNPDSTRIFELLLSRGLSNFEERLILRDLIRTLLRRGNITACSDLIDNVKDIDIRLYFSLLGIALSYLPTEEANKKFFDLLREDLNGFLIAFWEYVNEVKSIPESLPEIFLNALNKIKNASQAEIFARILAIALEKCEKELMKNMDFIISKLYHLDARDGLIELSLNYAKYLLRENIPSSLAYLDLAINLCYESGNQLRVLEIFKEYAAAALRLGLKNLLKNAIKMFSLENRIRGFQHLEIWQGLLQAAVEGKFGDLLEIFESTSEFIDESKHRIGIQSLITVLVSNEESEIIRALRALMNLNDPVYLILAITYSTKRGFTESIRYILNSFDPTRFQTKELSEILFAVAMGAVQNYQEDVLLETIEAARKFLLHRSIPIYASLINEISNRIIDYMETLALELLEEAAEFFEKSGMYWMSLNANAIISARRAYRKSTN